MTVAKPISSPTSTATSRWRQPYWLVALIAVLLATTVPAEEPAAKVIQRSAIKFPATPARLKSSPFNWLAGKTTKARGVTRSSQAEFASVDQGDQSYAVLNLEFKDAAACRAFNLQGTHVITRFDRFADVFIEQREDTWQALTSMPDLAWFDVATLDVTPPLPPVEPRKELTKAIPEAIALGGVDGYKGKGAIIAIVDSGVDFHHADFITKDRSGRPTSRLLYLWDTTSDAYASQGFGSAAPVTYPNGVSLGTVFNRSELTEELRTATPRLVNRDSNGHGTACASIAAGNGGALPDGRYVGVAPEADIVAVRISKESSAIENAYLLGAICQWLDEKAGSKPLVVSCSFGGHSGGHDGCLVRERQLDARFPDTAVGRAICVAAGNEGNQPFHAHVTFAGLSEPGRISWTVDRETVLELWVQSDAVDDVMIAPVDEQDIVADTSRSYLHPFSKHLCFQLVVAAGDGALDLASRAGKKLTADAYLPEDQEFSDDCSSPGSTVGTPGTAQQPITVGSFNWNDQFHHDGSEVSVPDLDGEEPTPLKIGELSGYSSRGYRRYGNVIKPDVVAPGQWYAAAAPLNRDHDEQLHIVRDTTGSYCLFNGTSAATPYVAGVVALLMEKKPTATFGELKKALQASASIPPGVTESPTPDWGYGKLDLKAVRAALNVLAKRSDP